MSTVKLFNRLKNILYNSEIAKYSITLCIRKQMLSPLHRHTNENNSYTYYAHTHIHINAHIHIYILSVLDFKSLWNPHKTLGIFLKLIVNSIRNRYMLIKKKTIATKTTHNQIYFCISVKKIISSELSYLE